MPAPAGVSLADVLASCSGVGLQGSSSSSGYSMAT